MKNIKFAFVAAIITFSALSFGAGIPDRPGYVQIISLEQAMSNQDMIQAMHEQINPDFLSLEQTVYYAYVEFANNLYLVYGELSEWKLFFMKKIKEKPQAILSSHWITK